MNGLDNLKSPDERLRELALFAGAGGGILGGVLLGWETVCAVEYEPYAAAVLAMRQNDGLLPPFPIWDDVRTFDGRPWRGLVDVVSGGFPCQGYSSAARGRNRAESHLDDYFRIVAEVAPRYVFAENVKRSAIEECAAGLENLGYTPYVTQLNAADLGADHIRPRFWLRAYSDRDSKLPLPLNAEASLRAGVRHSVWVARPPQPRVSDGVAHWVDELRATGNGQLPIVAALAWRLLGGPE